MSPDVESDGGVIFFSEIEQQQKFNENISALKELRESIKQSSEDIQKQLQNIDTKAQLITTFTLIVSIIALITLGQFFGFLKIIGLFWIPCSFLLWFLWMVLGIFTIKNWV
jgi:F0F1-type ATP synthase assembly protein I